MRTVSLDDVDLSQAFAAVADDGRPVCMLNLLKFRERADYSGHPQQAPRSGREAYRQYAELAFPIVAAAGARVVFLGTCIGYAIAPSSERWDDMLLVEYPTRGAFVNALTSADYRAIAFHRTAALLDSRLIALRGGVLSVELPGM